ncbi:hypothetical protein GCM10019016_039250 [Streptomyces prasinosporus]|uniref:Uncharacterized protein n=1 Tax=Streptomyces prasinosporus TaxID=68256 RepID=A0ABP6TPX4_9ACTN
MGEVALPRGAAGRDRVRAEVVRVECREPPPPHRAAQPLGGGLCAGAVGDPSRKDTAARTSYGRAPSSDSTACQQKSVARNSQACHTSLRCSRPTTGPVACNRPGGSSTTGTEGAVGQPLPPGRTAGSEPSAVETDVR